MPSKLPPPHTWMPRTRASGRAPEKKIESIVAKILGVSRNIPKGTYGRKTLVAHAYRAFKRKHRRAQAACPECGSISAHVRNLKRLASGDISRTYVCEDCHGTFTATEKVSRRASHAKSNIGVPVPGVD